MMPVRPVGFALFGALLTACARPAPPPPAEPAQAPRPAATLPVWSEHPAVRTLDLRPGRNLPLRSSGTEAGEAWVLDENGYVGTFIEVPSAGAVRVIVNATGHADQNVAPRMNVVVGALSWPFDVGSEASEHACTMDLAAGTHFVRIELVNDGAELNRQLEVTSVSIEGARLLPGARDEHALAAADTYIQNHRRGRARITFPGATPGAKAHVVLKRHAFNFGVNVPFADNRLIPEKPADPESEAAKYQQLVRGRFNSVALSNAGHWAHLEEKRDRVTTAGVDRFLRFAEQQQYRARMQALLGETAQQPAWLASSDAKKPGLLALAGRGDAKARAEVDAELDERIAYYVKERAKHYQELDVLSASVHDPRYSTIFGAAGLADLFNRAARAVRDAGAGTRLYLNEYDLLQWSRDPRTSAPDPYANWYRRHAEAILQAGGAVDGLGVRYDSDGRDAKAIGTQAHSAARVYSVLQNLSTTGLRLSLTEFSVKSATANSDRAAQILEETLKLTFGTPQADTFMLGAIWAKTAGDLPAAASVLFDERGELTAAGRRYDALLKAWTTDLELPVEPDGTIGFDGFFGDYTVTLGGTTREFTLAPGKSKYSL
jgi:GH35 family endo-1,4-beta-xylanase